MPQLASIERQLSATWQAIGDAHCRLGEYDDAQGAYRAAADNPSVNPESLLARTVYASLRLDRPDEAQAAVIRSLGDATLPVTDSVVSLCGYLAEQCEDVGPLRSFILDRRAVFPERPDLARAAAALLPRDEAVGLLRELLARRPDDLATLRQLIGDLAADDPPAAARLVAGLVEDRPERTTTVVRQLIALAREPLRILEALETLEPSVGRALAAARIHAELVAPGLGWRRVSAALERWPQDETLRLVRLELAAALQESALFDEAEAAIADLDDAESWMARSRAAGSLGRFEEAREAAQRAVALDPASGAAILEQARSVLALASLESEAIERQRLGEDAAELARRAAELDPDDEDALGLLLQLYGASGLLADAREFRFIARRLFARDGESRLYAKLAAEEAIGQGRAEQARPQLLALYESDPADGALLGLLVTSWTAEGRMDEAAAWVADRLGERPGNPDLIRWRVRLDQMRQRGDDAIAFLEDRLAAEPSDTASRGLLETAYRASERIAEALPLGEARLEERPEGVRRRLELAALYGGAGRLDRAAEQLEWLDAHADGATSDELASSVTLARRLAREEAARYGLALRLVETTIDRFPDAPLQVYAVGLAALTELGEPAARFTELAARAVDSRPADADELEDILAWRDLAQALLDSGAADAATEALRVRYRDRPPLAESARAVLTVIVLTADAAAGAPERSLRWLREQAAAGPLPDIFGSGEAPSLANLLFELSTIYALLGLDEGAELLLREVVTLEPDNATALNNLAYGRIDRGLDDAETVGWMERAHELEPDSAFVLDSVGWLRYKQGRFTDAAEGAIDLIVRSMEAGDGEPSAEVLDHLGDTRWRLGERDAAVEAWRRAEAQLEAPAHREQLTRALLRIQAQQWGLVVQDPEEMYDRDYGTVLDRVRAKLAASAAGEEPAVAPTFDEDAG
jgi:tetratricopeptide (TPR) repeat protein